MAIPSLAGAETAVIEASVTRAGKRAPVAALTLDVAPDRSTTEARAVNAAGAFEVKLAREDKAGKTGALFFDVELQRSRAGRFELRTARVVKPGVRTVIGAFRQAGGELLEVAVTLKP